MNVGPLEEILYNYELIVNNDTDFFICPFRPRILILNLALNCLEIGLL